MSKDWLDGEAAEKAAEHRSAAIETAKLHSVFVTDPRARRLLELWEQAADRAVPVNATIDEYARAETFRAFVKTIKDQIKVAQTQG